MDFILSCALFLSALIFSVSYGIHILFPLMLGLFCFLAMGIYRGFSLICVLKMMISGMGRVVIVLRMFFLIGIITAVWRACGTIPFFVYHGVSLIEPRFFILFAFVLSCFISLLIGSSIGSAATIGIILMTIARSSGADVNVTAGAIIAGIYFGDRCAPTSTSANLIAVLTKTDLLDNIKNMLRSALVPLVISLMIYASFSIWYGLDKTDDYLLSEIPANFSIGLVTAVPALAVIILSALRYKVHISMIVSIFFGVLIALFVQGTDLYELLNYMLTGYKSKSPEEQFARIISGGGIVSMLNIIGIVMISSAYSGIFEGTGALKDVIGFLKSCARKIAIYPVTLMTAFFTAAFGCTQSLSIILTNHLMRDVYSKNGLNNSALALDIEDSSVVVAALIPWNVAVAVPMIMLSVGVGSIPYAVFLYILPVYRIFFSFPAQRQLS